ncbi:hypothetical protein Tco_0721737 [Tanacetum coccineum]
MKYRHVRSILRVFNQLLRVLMCRPVASSSRVPIDGMRNLSTVTSVPVQPQTPMQYRPAQSMPPSLTDAMRNFSIVVSLPLVPSSSKLVKPRARQGFGSVGKKIMITANHFLVQLGDKNPHQYNIDEPNQYHSSMFLCKLLELVLLMNRVGTLAVANPVDRLSLNYDQALPERNIKALQANNGTNECNEEVDKLTELEDTYDILYMRAVDNDS